MCVCVCVAFMQRSLYSGVQTKMYFNRKKNNAKPKKFNRKKSYWCEERKCPKKKNTHTKEIYKILNV